jgi:hypothetical protein
MIELTETQRHNLPEPKGEPVRVLDPVTKQQYAPLSITAYEELTQAAYDDSPWTGEEMDLLAADVDAMLEDDMAIEDATA